MDRKSVMLSRVRIDLTKFIATSFRNTKYKNKYKRRRKIMQRGEKEREQKQIVGGNIQKY